MMLKVRQDPQEPGEEGTKVAPISKSPLNGRESEAQLISQVDQKPDFKYRHRPKNPSNFSRCLSMHLIQIQHMWFLITSTMAPGACHLELSSDLGFCHFFGSDFTSDR